MDDPEPISLARCRLDDCEWTTLVARSELMQTVRDHYEDEHGHSAAEIADLMTDLVTQLVGGEPSDPQTTLTEY